MNPIANRIAAGTDCFVGELERVIEVNEGRITQARHAELLGETMDWDAFYQAQGSL